jgi:hypothetical protein
LFYAFSRTSTNQALGAGGANKKESKQKAKQDGGAAGGGPNGDILIVADAGHSFGFLAGPFGASLSMGY